MPPLDKKDMDRYRASLSNDAPMLMTKNELADFIFRLDAAEAYIREHPCQEDGQDCSKYQTWRKAAGI